MPVKTDVSTQQTPPYVYEIIDAQELANRWCLPVTWIREFSRSRSSDPLPCVRFNRYVRYEWNSPALLAWLSKRRR
jgi:hypothetical protein